jgi:hypothetical protein
MPAEGADRVGAVEVGEHQDVEQLGAGGPRKRVPGAPVFGPPVRRSARAGGYPAGPVYAEGALWADQEGWVAQERYPSLDAPAGWTAQARGHGPECDAPNMPFGCGRVRLQGQSSDTRHHFADLTRLPGDALLAWNSSTPTKSVTCRMILNHGGAMTLSRVTLVPRKTTSGGEMAGT